MSICSRSAAFSKINIPSTMIAGRGSSLAVTAETAIFGEIVRWPVDLLARAKHPHMLDEQRRIECVRMIEVYPLAVFEREIREILVVVVLLEDQHARRRERLDDPVGDGSLPRTGTTADADNQRAGPSQCVTSSQRRVSFGVQLNALLFLACLEFQNRLRGGQSRHRDTIRRCTHVIHTYFVAEAHAFRVSAVLTADSHF